MNLPEIHSWLDAMEAEIRAFHGRMNGMLRAASTADRMASLCDVAGGLGLRCEAPEELALGGATAAWVFRAVKPLSG